uniref:Trafficking protein particle complex subunit n=1 Tax=Leersia perrieri TaxID=77586 RepID=A0A0D9VI94_9ORYZ
MNNYKGKGCCTSRGSNRIGRTGRPERRRRRRRPRAVLATKRGRRTERELRATLSFSIPTHSSCDGSAANRSLKKFVLGSNFLKEFRETLGNSASSCPRPKREKKKCGALSGISPHCLFFDFRLVEFRPSPACADLLHPVASRVGQGPCPSSFPPHPRPREDQAYQHQFILHASLDVVQDLAWATNTIFMLLHDSRSEDGIKSFFQEVHELYIKIFLNPLYLPGSRITSSHFDTKVRALARKYL